MVPALLAAVYLGVLGAFVYLRTVDAIVRRTFLPLVAVLMAWAAAEAMVRASSAVDEARFWSVVQYTAIALIMPAWLNFTQSYPREDPSLELPLLPSGVLAFASAWVVLTITGAVTSGVERHSFGYAATFGPLYAPFAFSFVGMALLSLLLFERKRRHLELAQERAQGRLVVLWGFTTIGAATFTDIVWVAIAPDPVPLAAVVVALTTAILAYAVVRYRSLTAEPRLEASLGQGTSEGLPARVIYIYPTSSIEEAAELLRVSLASHTFGLIVTYRVPLMVRQGTGLTQTPLLWLADGEQPHPSLPLDQLHDLRVVVERFTHETSSAVVLIDALPLVVTAALSRGTLSAEQILEELARIDRALTEPGARGIVVLPPAQTVDDGQRVVLTSNSVVRYWRPSGQLLLLALRPYIEAALDQGGLYGAARARALERAFLGHRGWAAAYALAVSGPLRLDEGPTMSESLQLLGALVRSLRTAGQLDLRPVLRPVLQRSGIDPVVLEIAAGEAYLIDDRPEVPYDVYNAVRDLNRDHLCLSRLTERAHQMLGVRALTLREDLHVASTGALPATVAAITAAVDSLLKGATPASTPVVLVDGIDLPLAEGRETLLEVTDLLRRLREEVCRRHHGVLLVSATPRALTPDQWSVLSSIVPLLPRTLVQAPSAPIDSGAPVVPPPYAPALGGR